MSTLTTSTFIKKLTPKGKKVPALVDSDGAAVKTAFTYEHPFAETIRTGTLDQMREAFTDDVITSHLRNALSVSIHDGVRAKLQKVLAHGTAEARAELTEAEAADLAAFAATVIPGVQRPRGMSKVEKTVSGFKTLEAADQENAATAMIATLAGKVSSGERTLESINDPTLRAIIGQAVSDLQAAA